MTAKAKAKISPLQAHLGYWLRFVSNQVSKSFADRLAASASISVAEWVALRELYDRDDLGPSVLAERLGMTRGAISKLVDRLIDKTLVSRNASETDRRFQTLALTAQGRALVPRLAALADENDLEFFGHLKASERKTIETAMREIVRRHEMKVIPID